MSGSFPAEPRFGFSLRGVVTVAAHEFRLRIRAGRWRWLLGGWFTALLLFTAALRAGMDRAGQANPGSDMFGGLVLVMLALALLVVPALTAQSINGDRARGVLATLQTTLLTPAEIALGKLAAAWGAALMFIVAALPIVLWSVIEGASLWRAFIALAVMALLFGVVCAIAQCLSSLMARSTTSAVLSYLTVFALTVGTVIIFAMTVTLARPADAEANDSAVVGEHSYPPGAWLLVAPNPFVIVADAAPRPSDRDAAQAADAESVRLDTLSTIADAVRSLRSTEVVLPDGTATRANSDAVWPFGLIANLLLGAGAVALTTHRLKTPAARLPRLVRVA
jgi:ABC-type transport system involved in multi-copper enzyme maturation permease subunit